MGPHDILITPDLRFSTPSGGPLDLRVRVTSNGDTCVENHNVGAPTVEVVEQFGDGHYLVPGGQHVLFEHGNVREVVDRESSPCGCPQTSGAVAGGERCDGGSGAGGAGGQPGGAKKGRSSVPGGAEPGAGGYGRGEGAAGAAGRGACAGGGDDGVWCGQGFDGDGGERPSAEWRAPAGPPVLPSAGGGAGGGTSSSGVGVGDDTGFWGAGGYRECGACGCGCACATGDGQGSAGAGAAGSEGYCAPDRAVFQADLWRVRSCAGDRGGASPVALRYNRCIAEGYCGRGFFAAERSGAELRERFLRQGVFLLCRFLQHRCARA